MDYKSVFLLISYLTKVINENGYSKASPEEKSSREVCFHIE